MQIKHTPKTRESTPVVGIIGGKGRMGNWFSRFFDSIGLKVHISDLDTELRPEDLPALCQVVIISTPMDVFPKVVKKVAPLMAKDAFLTDLCSLKLTQVKCMLQYAPCEVVGTHPLFGPAESSLSGKRVAICPGRGKRWLCWWEGLLKKHGAFTYITTAEEHDRTMAWVQALNHFILLCLGKAMEENELDLEKLITLGTPSFERQMQIVARLAMQDPALYSFIQMENPYADNAIKSFKKYGDILADIINRKDKTAFIDLFMEVQELGEILLEHEKKDSGS